VTDDQTDQAALDLLCTLGRVAPPAVAVVAAARESLWSAITDELLSADLAAGASRPQRRAARRPAARPRPDQRSPRRHRRDGSA
jgi:hypothetical protein